jgi:hypothetical protein
LGRDGDLPSQSAQKTAQIAAIRALDQARSLPKEVLQIRIGKRVVAAF